MIKDYNHVARMHTPISKRDLEGVNHNGPVTTYRIADLPLEKQIWLDGLKPPRNSEGQRMKRPIVGAIHDKQQQLKRKGVK